mmetsp:Transcript_46459/g.98545  ORF Transcript_46459/g.98545 Transcript_46459/m.98545 type:complete len:815 (+) Transcript_46459:84-2528(+)
MKMKRSLAFLSASNLLLPLACAFSAAHTTPATLGAEPIRLRPDGSAAIDVLCNLLKDDERTAQQTLVVLEGLVSKRRAMGKSLVFVDVIPSALPKVQTQRSNESTNNDFAKPVQAIMRRDVWANVDGNKSTMSSFDVYQKIIQPGVHVQLTGHAGPSRNAAEAILFCHSAKYVLPNDNPQHLRNVLRYVKDGALDFDEALDALPCIGREEFTNMIGFGKKNSEINDSFGELAKEVLSRFPRNYLSNPSQLMGSTNSQKLKLLPPAPPEYQTAPSFCFAENDTGDDIVTVATILLEQKQISESNAQDNFNSDKYKQFSVTGWVRNRRRYQGSISVLELVDDFSSLASLSSGVIGDLSNDGRANAEIPGTCCTSKGMQTRNSNLRDLWKERIYCALHPDVLLMSRGIDGAAFTTNSITLSEIYGNILSSGARVMLKGYLAASSLQDVPIFWATSCRLMRSSWRPSSVRLVLDLLNEGKISSDEASDALGISDAQAEDIANGKLTVTERQWISAELTQSLQGENSRIGKVTSSMELSLKKFAYARKQYPLEKITRSILSTSSSLQFNESFRRTSREGSFWQRAKKPQLEFMVGTISTVLRSHPEYGRRKLNIVDIGGGKGLLSNLLAETFGDEIVEVRVVDISRSATKNGMMRALKRGLKNIQYNAQDATMLDMTGVDIVVALHACGALTDVALGHAVCQGAGFVICPCCFQSNPHLRVSIPTDEGRELVMSSHWLDVDSSLYEHLKQLAELQGDYQMAGKAMHTICGLRLKAVDRLWHSSRWPSAELDIAIKTFPIGFSTRNFCLVGSFNERCNIQ